MAKITIEGTVEEIIAIQKGIAAGGFREVLDRDPEVGDYVKFTRNEDNEPFTVGRYYEIKFFDHCEDPHIIDDDGDIFDCCGEEYEVYAKEGAEVKKEELREQLEFLMNERDSIQRMIFETEEALRSA